MMQTSFSNYGRECPKCGRVYSPLIQQCFYCGEKGITRVSDCQPQTTTYPSTSQTINYNYDAKNNLINKLKEDK